MKGEIKMKTTKIKLKYGDLKEYIQVVSSFTSDIYMKKGNYVINAKSIMGILSIDFENEVEISIDSNDEIEISRFLKEMKGYK